MCKEYNNEDGYYLINKNETRLQTTIKDEFQIDIAFVVDEFNVLVRRELV